jgi:hypothetical protein
MGSHIMNVQERREQGKVTISGKCIKGTKLSDDPYKVEIEIDPQSRKWISGHCSCVNGIDGNCKHTAGLVFFVNTERTVGCTDEAKKWKKPAEKVKKIYPKGQTVEELLLGTFTPHATKKPTEEELQDLANKLAAFGLQDSGLYKTLTADTKNRSLNHIFCFCLVHLVFSA